MSILQHRLRRAHTLYTSHFAIHLPKIIKIGVNLTKF